MHPPAAGDDAAESSRVDLEPLDPTSFLTRSALLFGTRTAVVDRSRAVDYATLDRRAWLQAAALAQLGVAPGDRVAVLSPNSLMALESHYGVSRAGGVLVMLNTRLSAPELGWILQGSGSAVLLCDADLLELGRAAVARSGRSVTVLEVAVVAVPDPYWGEVPGAFVTLKPGRTADGAEIAEHVRQHLARFKAPKHVWFEPLPKTGSGKIQKFALRARAEGLVSEDLGTTG